MIGFIHPSMIGVGRLVDARRLWEPPYLSVQTYEPSCGVWWCGDRRAALSVLVICCYMSIVKVYRQYS